MSLAQADVTERWHVYEQMAGIDRHAPDASAIKDAEPAGTAAAAEEDLA